jgi:hypothetical protein
MKKEYHIEERMYRKGPLATPYYLYFIKKFQPFYLIPWFELFPIGEPALVNVTDANDWPLCFESLEDAREWCVNMCKELPEPRVLEIIKCETK